MTKFKYSILMRQTLILLCSTIFLFISCNEGSDPFLITKHSVGLLTDSTAVKDIAKIFMKDSIVNRNEGNDFTGSNNDIEVYDASGQLMLVLSPKERMDSTSTISTIKIVDPKYHTELGLNANSTFGDIEANYDISSIQNTIRNVVVFVNNINGFFTIDKMELPAELRFDMSKDIESIHIPDQAKIKYFMIGW